MSTTSFDLLTPDQQDLRQMVHDFADEEIIPTCKELEIEGIFPEELYKKAYEMGLTTMILPEKYGGMGLDIFTYSICKEELARGDAGFAGAVAGSFMGSLPARLFGTDYQIKTVTELLCNGGAMAFALTEAESGSDSAAMRTTYVDDGDAYVINGSKTFISGGEHADMFLVFATFDRELRGKGVSAFYVDAKTPGLSIGKKENKMGYRTSDTVDIIFDNVRVPKDMLIGKEGEGMMIMSQCLNRTRPTAGAGAIGNAQYAFEIAADYSTKRMSFGKPICKHQGIGFKLAEMYTLLEAGRLMCWQASKTADAGIVDAKLFSAAKVFASDAGMKVCSEAVQILGGYGYSKEYPVEKRFRDAKIYQIFEGTNEIQKMVISKDITKEMLPKKA